MLLDVPNGDTGRAQGYPAATGDREHGSSMDASEPRGSPGDVGVGNKRSEAGGSKAGEGLGGRSPYGGD